MQNNVLLVNKKTFEKLKEQIPTDKSMFSLINFATNLYNSIRIEIDDELEDNIIKIKEDKE